MNQVLSLETFLQQYSIGKLQQDWNKHSKIWNNAVVRWKGVLEKDHSGRDWIRIQPCTLQHLDFRILVNSGNLFKDHPQQLFSTDSPSEFVIRIGIERFFSFSIDSYAPIISFRLGEDFSFQILAPPPREIKTNLSALLFRSTFSRFYMKNIFAVCSFYLLSSQHFLNCMTGSNCSLSWAPR